MTPEHKAARIIFKRDDFTCQYCDRQFPPEQPPLHNHHRVFVSQGGDDDPENKVAACAWCHSGDNHAKLKGAKLFNEKDYSIINGLTEKYRRLKWKRTG